MLDETDDRALDREDDAELFELATETLREETDNVATLLDDFRLLLAMLLDVREDA